MPYGVYMGRFWQGKEKFESAKIKPYSLGHPLELQGDFVIIGDIHVPFTDYDWVGLVCAIGKRHLSKPRQLLICGDFFSFDIFSSYAKVIAMPSWKDEKAAAQSVMRDFVRVFDKIYILMGNHERRLGRATEGELNEGDIADFLGINVRQVEMSRFGYCTITSGSQTWRATHSKSYRVNQLSAASDLANKWGCNIIANHSHHLAQGWDKYKRFVVVDNGCLVNPDALAYVSLDDTTAAGMAQGFTMLRRGVAYVFGREPFTDWGTWLG